MIFLSLRELSETSCVFGIRAQAAFDIFEPFDYFLRSSRKFSLILFEQACFARNHLFDSFVH